MKRIASRRLVAGAWLLLPILQPNGPCRFVELTLTLTLVVNSMSVSQQHGRCADSGQHGQQQGAPHNVQNFNSATHSASLV